MVGNTKPLLYSHSNQNDGTVIEEQTRQSQNNFLKDLRLIMINSRISDWQSETSNHYILVNKNKNLGISCTSIFHKLINNLINDI